MFLLLCRLYKTLLLRGFVSSLNRHPIHFSELSAVLDGGRRLHTQEHENKRHVGLATYLLWVFAFYHDGSTHLQMTIA